MAQSNFAINGIEVQAAADVTLADLRDVVLGRQRSSGARRRVLKFLRQWEW